MDLNERQYEIRNIKHILEASNSSHHDTLYEALHHENILIREQDNTLSLQQDILDEELQVIDPNLYANERQRENRQ